MAPNSKALLPRSIPPISLSVPEGEFEGTLIGRAGMHRLAVRDDHVLERKLKQRAQRWQRSLLMRRRSPNAQLAFRGRQRPLRDYEQRGCAKTDVCLLTR